MTFEERISKAIKESVSACNYKPSAFIQMIDNYGTENAVKRLINSSNVSAGYIKLYEKKRLDLTVEAIALEEEWSHLFSEKELKKAETRLRDYNYSIPPRSKNPSWTNEELEAVLKAYIDMLKNQESGIDFKKSHYNAVLRNGSLSKRTKASIEFRMRNISAVFQGIKLPIINGYLPAKNVGINVVNEIIKLLEKNNFFENTNLIPDDEDISISHVFKKGKILRPIGSHKPRKKTQESTIYSRNPLVKIFVLQRAAGKCELCSSESFLNQSHIPFLEVHHLEYLSVGGADIVTNAVALCPNCHRELHYGINREVKKAELLLKLKKIEDNI